MSCRRCSIQCSHLPVHCAQSHLAHPRTLVVQLLHMLTTALQARTVGAVDPEHCRRHTRRTQRALSIAKLCLMLGDPRPGDAQQCGSRCCI